MRAPVVGVMGGHDVPSDVEALARELGAAIAAQGWILLTGGRAEGVMAAATDGAREAGGFTVGVHPGTRDGEHAAADADLIIYTGIGFARNSINVLSSDVIIALPGAAGTLSEVAFAETFGTPAILLGFDDKGWFEDVPRASTVAEAVVLARGIIAAR